MAVDKWAEYDKQAEKWEDAFWSAVPESGEELYCEDFWATDNCDTGGMALSDWNEEYDVWVDVVFPYGEDAGYFRLATRNADKELVKEMIGDDEGGYAAYGHMKDFLQRAKDYVLARPELRR